MNVKFTALFAAAALVLAPAVFADSKPQAPEKKDAAPTCEACKDGCKCEAGQCKCEKKPKAEKPKKDERVVLTGSRIPQKVTRVGLVTDGMHPVTVITADDLARTGQGDVAGALRHLVPALR